MSAPPVRLDFAARRRRRDATGIVLLAAGVLSTVAMLASYQRARTEAEGLELRRDALASAPSAAGDLGNAGPRVIDDANAVIAELATPWATLLRELEAANADSGRTIALLAIEPDREHRKVRIFAESRTLPAALAYAERLQKSTALRFPLLESHEVQVKDQYRPVRFQIAADWSVPP